MGTKVSEIIEKRAIKTMVILPAAKEWSEIIILTSLIKFGTALFAVLAGFHWISTKFESIGTVASVLFGLVFIGIIESLNAVFLHKATKMVLHKRWIVAAFLYFISLVVFCCSFVISTEGLASWKQNQPRANVPSNQSKIETSYNDRITALNNDIDAIKRNTWKGKLSIEQERRMSSTRQNIENLEAEKIAAIEKEQSRVSIETQKINAEVNIKASEFHQIAAVVMGFQLIGNCLLAFLMFVVMDEKEQKSKTVDAKMNEFINEHGELFSNQLAFEYKNRVHSFFHSLNVASLRNGYKFELPSIYDQAPEEQTGIVEPVTSTKIMGEQIQPKQTKIIGFQRSHLAPESKANEQPVNNGVVNNGVVKDGQTSSKSSDKNSLGTAVCPTCGRMFEMKAWNQIYCNSDKKDTCKKIGWSQKTGQPISKIYQKKQ